MVEESELKKVPIFPPIKAGGSYSPAFLSDLSSSLKHADDYWVSAGKFNSAWAKLDMMFRTKQFLSTTDDPSLTTYYLQYLILLSKGFLDNLAIILNHKYALTHSSALIDLCRPVFIERLRVRASQLAGFIMSFREWLDNCKLYREEIAHRSLVQFLLYKQPDSMVSPEVADLPLTIGILLKVKTHTNKGMSEDAAYRKEGYPRAPKILPMNDFVQMYLNNCTQIFEKIAVDWLK